MEEYESVVGRAPSGAQNLHVSTVDQFEVAPTPMLDSCMYQF
jgi:hypothetical protein